MKLKVGTWRIVWTFAIAVLAAGILLFGMCFPIFMDWPWDWRPYVIIAMWVISSIVFLILSLTRNYFILEKDYICAHKGKKELFYYFKDIIYIDKEYSEKHKTIVFVTNKGDVRYLPFDKKGLMYEAMLKKCKNLCTFEEMKRKYPSIKGVKAPK